MKIEKNFYSEKNAIVFLGGTSIARYLNKLGNINKDKNVIFIESKLISEVLIKNNLDPDYIICPFPDKLKDNYLQNIIFRSLKAKVNIKFFIKKEFFDEVDYIKDNFDKFFEEWKPNRGIHKRIKYKKNIYLKNSPYENLKYFPNSKIFTNIALFNKEFETFKYKNEIINLNFVDGLKNFDKEYFKVNYENNTINIFKTNFLNSQTICNFPLLNFFGFKKIFFLGLDMDFFGSYEYRYLDIFRSKFHFYSFLFLIRKTLNGNFKMNFPIYLRPKEEFFDLNKILKIQNNFIRVLSRQDKLLPYMKNILIDDFLKIIK